MQPLSATAAKERILTGNIQGNFTVTEDLDLSYQNIPQWPVSWVFRHVNLQGARVPQLTGTFHSIDASNSYILRVNVICTGTHPNGYSANFKESQNLTSIGGTFQGSLVCSACRKLETLATNLIVGSDADGNSAWFNECPQLQQTNGQFAGFTDWEHSGIRCISDTTVFGKNKHTVSASFCYCRNLTELHGIFPGSVNCRSSGVNKIRSGTQFAPNSLGTYADFANCCIAADIYKPGICTGIRNVTWKLRPPQSIEF